MRCARAAAATLGIDSSIAVPLVKVPRTGNSTRASITKSGRRRERRLGRRSAPDEFDSAEMLRWMVSIGWSNDEVSKRL